MFNVELEYKRGCKAAEGYNIPGETMRTLAPDEKLVMVMVYTQNMLVRGELIAPEGVRVSIWLRNQGISNYVHLVNSQVLMLGSGAPKSVSYSESYIPTDQVTAFHIAPPAADPLDYDLQEGNRMMAPVTALAGSFLIKAKMRISAQTDLGQSLDVVRTAWLSLYEAEITNPTMAQFNIQVPMLLVSSTAASFGV
jgi:hypothetical protein